MRRPDSTVLIFRIGSLGDTIVALPCFHRIALSFPDSRRVVVTDRPSSQKVTSVESVLGDCGLINEVIYFPPPPRSVGDFLALRRQIRHTNATTLVYIADRGFYATVRDVWFFHRCGIKKTIGAPLTRDLRRLRVDPSTGHTEHEAERLARCLTPLGAIDIHDPVMWDLRLQAAEMRAADTALAPIQGGDFIAVSLGGKDAAKDWGNDNWKALLEIMSKHLGGAALVFIGSADEFARCAIIAAQWHGPTLNLCGRLSVRESAAAMRRGKFFLGHDCGPMHLAAAVGTPCVAVFGPANMPKWWHPIGAHHHVIHNMRSIRNIAPAEVAAAVGRIVGEPRSVSHPVGVMA
jgi:heptosyltransferase III